MRGRNIVSKHIFFSSTANEAKESMTHYIKRPRKYCLKKKFIGEVFKIRYSNKERVKSVIMPHS